MEYPPFPGLDGPETTRSVEDERAHRKFHCALGYRVFGALHWGQLGDGHISARDPELTDHFWLLNWGVPFREATVDDLVLVSPEGDVVSGDGAVNIAGFHIHAPLHAARPDVVAAAHTHTPYGTPWSANARLFEAIVQEACTFVFDQALFDDEEVEVQSTGAGARIAAALGSHSLVILRSHGLLTVGTTVEDAIGLFVSAERTAEAHVKAPDAEPISDEAAKKAAEGLAAPHFGWRVYQWLVRDLIPDQSVVLG